MAQGLSDEGTSLSTTTTQPYYKMFREKDHIRQQFLKLCFKEGTLEFLGSISEAQ